MRTRSKLSLRSLLVVPSLLLACGDGGESVWDIGEPLIVEGADCRVEYVVSGEWSTGFGAEVKVTNKKSSAVKGWKLGWDFPAGQKVTSLWNANYVQSGAHVDVSGPSWSADLPANSTQSFGFNGSLTGPSGSPAKFFLNGVDCGSPSSTTGSGGTSGTGGSSAGGSTSKGGTSGTGGTSSSGGNTSGCNYPAWQQGASYRTGDIVLYEGKYYVAEHDNPGYSPTISTWYWDPYSGGCGTGGTSGTSGTSGTGGSGGTSSTVSGFSSIVSRATWDQMFPNRNALYGYDAIVAATQAYPRFASEGTSDQRKREVAAFLANIAHETTGGWSSAPGGPYAWGLYFIEEVACTSGGCTQYCAPSGVYPCSAGQTYHGRGPMQLSWNYNYGQAGQALGVDLLGNPNLVKTDGVVAFKTAVWFWMTAQSPKPAAHDVMAGGWSPTADDASGGRQPGFGMTVNIINGGLECNRGVDYRVQDRIGFYERFCSALGVSQGSNVDCYSMRPY